MKKNKDPLAEAARLLNENAPEGESLAYINSAEAKMLKDAGGAGEPVNSSGVPSYFLQKLFGGGKEPPKMPKFDAGQSALDYTKAMSDPRLQKRLLETRQTYDPMYQDLQMSLAQRAADPMATLAEQEARRAQEFGGEMAERQAGTDISLISRFGPGMTQAIRASDPLQQQRVEQLNLLAQQAAERAQMTDLSPEMRRRATQSAREGLVARGRDLDNIGIAAEAMSREDYLRDLRSEALREAQGLGGLALSANRATSFDPLRLTRGGADYTQQGYGARAALFGMPQEQVTRINPDAGVNIGLQEAANRAAYQAQTYAAREQAAAGMAGGLMGMIGSLGSAMIAGPSMIGAGGGSSMGGLGLQYGGNPSAMMADAVPYPG